MNIFKLITTLAITFAALIVFGIVIMYVAVNPNVLIVIGIGLSAIIEAIKHCRS